MIEQTDTTLGLSEIRTADTPPVHIIHRQGASLSPLVHPQCQLQVSFLHHPQPQPTAGVETPPTGPSSLRQIQNIQLQVARHQLGYRMRCHPSFENSDLTSLFSSQLLDFTPV